VNILFLGVDRAPEGTTVARTDTMILATVKPLEPYVGMLSIPRDLWVNVPGFGMNRINTAHFFAENSSPGTGPQAAMDTVEGNFGVNVNYYVRLQFQGFRQFVDALGGVEIELEKPTGGYPPGRHLLNGEQALAFVRDRKGTDDFFRMSQGQIFIRATLRKLLHPASWVKIPGALPSLVRSLDTDIPLWQWPRLAIALLRTGPDGLAFHSISREMATGFTTDQGAQVLAPNWSLINPVLREMFGQ
jgi:LCP family protein required for cell wall assembly